MKQVAVVGGGISGLAAAYELRQRLPDASIVVHEASERFGGKVSTSPFAGRLVDEGADAFLARVPWGLDLCQELGIETSLVSPAASSAYVWWDGALRQLPAGLVLGVPTDLDALRASGIVTEPVLVRPAARPLAPDEDASVGALVRPQLGDPIFERLVDPLLGGINAGDGDRLSVRSAAPQLAAAAERDRDLVAGLRSAPPAGPGPVFYAPTGGMGALTEALVDWLRAHAVDLRPGSALQVADADADGVIVALPAHAASESLRRVAPTTAGELQQIEYASVALVTMAFDRAAVHRPLDGSGYLVPRTTGLLMSACSWASSKWAHLAPAPDGVDGPDGPDGSVIVRASTGRLGDERFVALDDDVLVARLLEELAETSEIDGSPREVRINRWMRSFPQYEPGHLDLVDRIQRQLAEEAPNVIVTGAAFRGLGVPACIRQGREAAVELIERAGA
jgi:oxygen-dependent protoporphyrinogen oxidase